MGLFSKKREGEARSFGADERLRSDHFKSDIHVRRKKEKPIGRAALCGAHIHGFFHCIRRRDVLFALSLQKRHASTDRTTPTAIFSEENLPGSLDLKDRLLQPTAIATSENVFEAWTREVKKRLVVERKIKSVSLSDSLIGDPSDHIFLGIFERDELNRKNEAALHFYIALANGHPDAYRSLQFSQCSVCGL